MIHYAIHHENGHLEEVSRESFESVESKYNYPQFRLDEYSDHCVLVLFDFNGYFKGIS